MRETGLWPIGEHQVLPPDESQVSDSLKLMMKTDDDPLYIFRRVR